MTKEESILISAYTGFLVTKDFAEVHHFIETTMERPVFTHEMGNASFYKTLQAKLYPQVIKLVQNIKEEEGK